MQSCNDYFTRWKSARFHGRTNLESLSPLLRRGVRFFHLPIPAPSSASLAIHLPYDLLLRSHGRRIRLTTFPQMPERSNAIVISCLGSVSPPVVMMTTYPQIRQGYPTTLPFG